MQKNVGGYDRIARFVVGPILIAVGAAAVAGLLTIAAGVTGLVIAGAAILVGGILTVTATTQKCPLNAAIGLNTYESHTGGRSSTDDVRPSTK
jgi:uncharacterized membrane protein